MRAGRTERTVARGFSRTLMVQAQKHSRLAGAIPPLFGGGMAGLTYHTLTNAPLLGDLATYSAAGAAVGGIITLTAFLASRGVSDSSLPVQLPQSIGDYEFVRELGKGGYGIVYLALNRAQKPPRLEVIKQLQEEFAADDEAKARFKREAEALRIFKHPGIPEIYAVGEDADGIPFIAMEFIEGVDLHDYIQTFSPLGGRRRIPLKLAADILIKLHEIFIEIHNHGIIHRDIKPENIKIVISKGRLMVRIVDFGLVRDLRSRSELTRVGFAVGTPEYMSPEQLKGEKVSPASDIYALGVLLFEMLTGEPPYVMPQPTRRAGDPRAFWDQVLTGAIPNIADFLPEVPPLLDRLLQKMLAKKLEERPTHQEIIRDLTTILRLEDERTRITQGA